LPLDTNRTTARLKSTAELLDQMATENRNALEALRISDIPPEVWLDYREIIDTLSNTATGARALADRMRTPPAEEATAA
jgi:hypothetical protein